MKGKCFLICMLLWGMSCVKAQTSDVDKMFPNVVLTRENYDKVKTALEKADNTAFPMNWYIKQIETPAKNIVESNRKTTPDKSIDENPDKIDISNEMKAIHQLCLAYAFTQDRTYLNKAVEYLKAWSEINVALSKRNIHEESYNIAVEGYSLIRKVIGQSDRELIDTWLRKRAEVFIKDNDLRVNNWGTCLLQRCKACRDARKNAARGPREYFTAVCAACGGEAKVPFEPKSDRPVYCSECFAKMREQG